MTQTQKSQHLNVMPISRAYSPVELVDGLVRRDRQAAAAFFDQYAGQINHLVMKFLGPDDAHDDVVNTVMAEILSSAKRIKDPQTLTRWVSMVTINGVRLELRRRKYRRLFFDGRVAVTDEMSAVSGDQEKRSQIYKIIKTLNENEQIVFVLHYLEGNTYDEIAALEQISIATAKRRGKSAKDKFMRRVEGNARLLQLMEGL